MAHLSKWRALFGLGGLADGLGFTPGVEATFIPLSVTTLPEASVLSRFINPTEQPGRTPTSAAPEGSDCACMVERIYSLTMAPSTSRGVFLSQCETDPGAFFQQGRAAGLDLTCMPPWYKNTTVLAVGGGVAALGILGLLFLRKGKRR